MKIINTKIDGVFIIDPEPKEDNRGYFVRVFAEEVLKENGINYKIVHINRSLTIQRGTIRGLHYQDAPYGEDKIVQCLAGEIFDVALDLRKNSVTYGKWVGEKLSSENKKMLLIPKGFAHGFQTLARNTVVEYFVTQKYTPEAEHGIRWNDNSYNISWPIKNAKLSDKDANWPLQK